MIALKIIFLCLVFIAFCYIAAFAVLAWALKDMDSISDEEIIDTYNKAFNAQHETGNIK